MTTTEKIARRKLTLLELAKDLGNVSKACKMVGYSREQFYEIRRNFQTYGAEGLVDRMPGAKHGHPNRIEAEIETAILDFCLDNPSYGPVRVAQELALKGVNVSSGGVRGVWARHDLLTKHERLLRLEKAMQEKTMVLSSEQVRLLERFNPEFRDRHIEANHTGELVAVDTFMVGALKGVGRVYLQTAIDCHSRFAFGRLYTNKMPVTAVHMLNTDVLPFFEQEGVRIETILSDNGREFCGRPDKHPYELFLQLEGIDHRTTRVRRPQSNGIAERLNRTLLDEHFRVAGRKKWYETVEEMQKDFEEYMQKYNYSRPHQGRGMEGKTPYQVFKGGVKEAKIGEVNPVDVAA
jgi:transposase InsO family protein